MSLNNIEISEKLVPKTYLKLAREAQKCNATATRELFEKRKLPEESWSDEHIEDVVRQLAAFDSNNYPHNIGLGEREARIACGLVARRHYNFGHGIGRSGDLLEPQPKAAGSTLLGNLTNALLLELIRIMGVHSCTGCFLVPVATGMTLTLCMLALKKLKPQAKYVLWSRIDQKSCFKSITSAGLIPIILDTKLSPTTNTLETNIEAFEEQIINIPNEKILCLYTTTSCFAPRNCDDIVAIAKLAQKYNLAHLINNAYGLQSTYLTHQLNEAQRQGRVDLFVQSTDKNLLVPVGGAIVAGFDAMLLKVVAQTYAGRASSSQTLDVFMTLLSLGKPGFQHLIKERKTNFAYLRKKLQAFALRHGEQVLDTNKNPISLAMTLSTFNKSNKKNVTSFGAMLYTRGVSGVRVVSTGADKEIDGYLFKDWCTHHTGYEVSYLTVAGALGIIVEEIDKFFLKLESCWLDHLKTC